MLYDEIKKANVEAMKAKDSVARGIYSVLLNKIMLENIKKREKGEDIVDADIFNILQKTIKELAEESENYVKVGNKQEADKIKAQIKIVEKYLPKLLSKEEMRDFSKMESIPKCKILYGNNLNCFHHRHHSEK